MLPVSVLPVAGILLGVGSANFSWLPEIVSQIMAASGDAIFGNLPLLFAIGVAIGLTENDGVAALAGTVGFVVFLAAMGVCAKLRGIETATIMGIPSIETGVFGGIIVGLIAACGLQSLLQDPAPAYLGFFAGKRSVPIITAFAVIVAAAMLSFVWPPIGNGIDAFSHWAVHGQPALAFTHLRRGRARAHSVRPAPRLERAVLLPGRRLHRSRAPAQIVHGEIARFIAGDPTAGNMTGGYLFKMWGLPAAALAMWRAARPEQRAKVGGIMISAALTAFLTGITEPIEFAFLFVAPVLYAIHALLAGVAYFVCIALGIKHGFTFSHGLDRLRRALSRNRTNALWLLVLGPIWAAVYFRHLHLRDPPLQPAHAGPRSWSEAEGGHRRRAATVRAAARARLRRTQQHRQPRRLHHAAAREARRRQQGQRRQAQGARRRRRGRGRRRRAGDLRHAKREPEDRDGEYLKTAGPEADEVEAPSPVKAPARPASSRRCAIRSPQKRPAPDRRARRQGQHRARGRLRRDAPACRRDERRTRRSRALKAAGIEAVVKLPDHVVHLLAGLNADQYAAEMRGQLAGETRS